MAEKNPRVFMDVSVNKVPVGSMSFELFPKVAPKAAENFRALCTGERGIGKKYGVPLLYRGTHFYDIWKGYSYIKGGDLSRLGNCGESIYGGDVPDEKPTLECNERGLLAMNMFDWYGIGSHFVITLEPDDKLKRFHIVFGKLVDGWETLDAITKAPLGARVRVTGCGEFNGDGRRIYGGTKPSKPRKPGCLIKDGSKSDGKNPKKARMCN